MKTSEQINKAQDLIKALADYVELAKVEKKLKLEITKDNVSQTIAGIVVVVNEQVKDL